MKLKYSPDTELVPRSSDRSQSSPDIKRVAALFAALVSCSLSASACTDSKPRRKVIDDAEVEKLVGQIVAKVGRASTFCDNVIQPCIELEDKKSGEGCRDYYVNRVKRNQTFGRSYESSKGVISCNRNMDHRYGKIIGSIDMATPTTSGTKRVQRRLSVFSNKNLDIIGNLQVEDTIFTVNSNRTLWDGFSEPKPPKRWIADCESAAYDGSLHRCQVNDSSAPKILDFWADLRKHQTVLLKEPRIHGRPAPRKDR